MLQTKTIARVIVHFACCCIAIVNSLFAWNGKVFHVDGSTITVSVLESGTIFEGTNLYILRDGKEVGRGIVKRIFHSRVEMRLTGGLAATNCFVTNRKPGRSAEVRPKRKRKLALAADVALIKAVSARDFTKVAEAIAAGANVDAKSDYGETALIIAAGFGDTSIATLLVAAKANLDAQDKDGKTALMWAVVNGQESFAQLLIAAGADLNARDADGRTALMLVARNGHANTIRRLISAGADLNAKDYDGETALKIAKQRGEVDNIRLLIAAGARE